VIMAGIREDLDLCDVPKPLRGAAITLIVSGIMALGFMGFTGVDRGLKEAMESKTDSPARVESPPAVPEHARARESSKSRDPGARADVMMDVRSR
jgi:electron transport complex protein RnfA